MQGWFTWAIVVLNTVTTGLLTVAAWAAMTRGDGIVTLSFNGYGEGWFEVAVLTLLTICDLGVALWAVWPQKEVEL